MRFSTPRFVWASPDLANFYGKNVRFIISRRRDPFQDPSSPEALQMIETWLSDCISKHERCKTREKPPLPTYLIDVGDKDSHEVKLIRTKGNEDYPFIALSYVWGVPRQPIELRKHTIECMLAGISEVNIPLTILDAIKITRNLGYQYLWVDSFCIVQDDKVMKAGEISKMGSIFGHSVLTIQAASAETVNTGFLHLRAHGDVPEQRLRYNSDSDECIMIRPKHPIIGVHAPTNARAWCYEESVLPKRFLMFGRDELAFKCNTVDLFESGKLLNGRDRSGPGLFGTLTLSSEYQKPPYNGDRRLWILKTWYDNIDAMYSPRLLTKAHDRLPAIEGVARRIQRWAGGRYVAGLWESDLMFGLLWHTSDRLLPHWDFTVTDWVRKRRKSGFESIPNDRPSWAWASVEGPVLHTPRGKFEEAVAQVGIPSKSLREPDNPFGAIDGRLWMSAPTRAVTLEPRFHEDGSHRWIGAITQEIVCPETGMIKSETIGEAYSDMWLTAPKSVWCAAVIRRHGLLLEPIDESRNVYCRVGLFRMIDSYWEMEPKFAGQEKVELEII
jgi:hypothetical protein